MKKLLLPALCAILPVFAQASFFATGGEETIIDNGATAVHSFTNSGTFTLSQDRSVRILLVGGGGGGGAECGGGGGGGGVIEEVAYALEAGAYYVSVGAGGIGGRTGTDRGNGIERGGQGGDTTFSNATGTVVLRALGGGGGGAWSNNSGINGGCGGGGASKGTGGLALDPSQGFDAGSPLGGENSLPSGGGGAGGASASISETKFHGPSGAGGPGRTSDIAGTSEMYGAGGGGGNYDWGNADSQATGGDGIGGFGQGNTNALQPNMKGRDGFGGGGGGGSNKSTYIAGDGGCGAVIVRLANTDAVSPDPVFVVTGTTPGADTVDFSVAVSEAGSLSPDGTFAVYAQIADDASAWDAQTGAFSGTDALVGTNLLAGTRQVRATGLRPSHAYVAKIVVRTSGGGESVSAPVSFSTTALVEARWTKGSGGSSATSVPGLYQKRVFGNKLMTATFDPSDDGVTVQIGAIAAGIANHTQNGCNPIHGAAYVDEAGRSWGIAVSYNYLYRGYIRLEAGTTYHFFCRYWDGARLTIDGTQIVRSDGANTATGTYVCQTSGWHEFAAWLCAESGGSNFGVTPGWSLGMGWNTGGEASPSGVPGAGWAPLENEGTNVFLRTQPIGRMVDISAWSTDAGAGTATFAAALGAGDSATDLYAVWGPVHGGDSTNGWAHVARVGSAAVGAGEETASFTVQDLSDLTYFRFVAVDGSELFSWSPSQYVDLSNPSVSIASVVHQGDRATVSIRVDSVGTGTFSLRLLWGENADLSGASVTNVATDGPGVYDVVVAVTPGATTYYRAEASTTDGGSDATATDSFTTLAGSDLSESKSASVANHWITFSGHLETVGAGATTVTLWTGESADALVADPEPIVVATTGTFNFRRLFPGAPRTIYWKFKCENAGGGTARWSDETAVGTASTSEYNIVYTWKTSVAEGDWSDTNSWTTATEGAFGYPTYAGTCAAFAAGTTARVLVDGDYAAKILIFDRSNVDVTLAAGTNAVSSLYTGDSSGGSFAGSRLALDGTTLEEQDFFDWWVGSSTGAGGRLAVTNGAVLKLGGGGAFGLAGTGTGVDVGPGSAFLFGDPDTVYRNNRDPYAYLVLAAIGEVATVEGRFVSRALIPETPDGESNQWMRIRGPGGIVRVANGLFGDVGVINAGHQQGIYKNPHPVLRDFGVVFEPVAGAFTNTVSYSVDGTDVVEAVPLASVADAGRALGEMVLEESVGRIRLSVDVSSMRHSSKSAKQHFVLWRTGIDTDHVELVQGKGYTLHYTYGWPSTLSAPENEGDLPTGVWADVPATACTMILVK